MGQHLRSKGIRLVQNHDSRVSQVWASLKTGRAFRRGEYEPLDLIILEPGQFLGENAAFRDECVRRMRREAAFYALAHERLLSHPRGMARGSERLAAPYHDIGLGSQAIHLQAIRSRTQGEVLAVAIL